MYNFAGERMEGSVAVARGLEATLDLLESMGIRVLIVGAPPAFPFDVPMCLWRVPGRCYVPRSWNEHARGLSGRSVEEAIRGRHEARFVELFGSLCPGQSCEAGTLDEPLLTDRLHVSAIAAERRVLPILSRHLDWLRGAPEANSRPDRINAPF
jgi:hypothetical protein